MCVVSSMSVCGCGVLTGGGGIAGDMIQVAHRWFENGIAHFTHHIDRYISMGEPPIPCIPAAAHRIHSVGQLRGHLLVSHNMCMHSTAPVGSHADRRTCTGPSARS